MPLLLLVLVPAAFGLNPVIGRTLAGDVLPATLTAVRWLLAVMVIGAIAALRGSRERWQPPAGHLPRLLLLGALGMGFCSYAAYAGVATATATTVGLIYACTAAFVALYEIVTGRQRPTPILLAGLAACIAGVAVILTRGDPARFASLAIGRGELWALAGTIGWAAYTVAMTRQPVQLTPFAQFTIMATAGGLVCLPVAGLEVAATGLPVMTPALAAWFAALVLITGCAAFIGYNISLGYNGPVLTAASISLAPLYIAGLAIVLIGEVVAWYHVVAIALVAAGLTLINLDRVRARR